MLVINHSINEISDCQLEKLIRDLPEWRRAVVDKLKHRGRKVESALSYKMLCDALRENFGIEEKPDFEYNEHGKPFLRLYPYIHFNISHCKNGIAVIVDKLAVGVDIECLGRYTQSLARYSMNEDELEIIESSDDPDVEFTTLWTQKEALFKLDGTGIRDNIKDLLKQNRAEIETSVNKDYGFVVSTAVSLDV